MEVTMNIACLTDSLYLGEQVERAVAPLCQRFTLYHSVAALTRGLDRQDHEVILLSGDDDLIEKFLTCRADMERRHRPSIILLTERDCGSIVERALDAGVDDYLSIASGLAQLLPRIRACTGRRRHDGEERCTLALHDVALDRRDCSARLRGVPVDLTGREFQLAWVLFSNARSVVSVRALAEAVWGTSAEVAKRTIEQHVYRLRAKLQLRNPGAWHLTTVYGRGYRLDTVRPLDATPDPIAPYASSLAVAPARGAAHPASR
jgi:DNA-binding response OmpR family regulator